MSNNVVPYEEWCRVIAENFGEDALLALSPSGDWAVDMKERGIRRPDGRYHKGVVKDVGGYYALILIEEPLIEADETGLREVGQVLAYVAPDGTVRTREGKNTRGVKHVELFASSVSKGEVTGTVGTVHSECNPNRIDGDIGGVLIMVDDHEEAESMDPAEFIRRSTDDRSISKLVKLAAEFGTLTIDLRPQQDDETE